MSSRLINILKTQGIQNQSVLHAIASIDRSRFLPKRQKNHALLNQAFEIDCGQTISQPYVVARMTELLLMPPYPNRVLEIGTGSGYQAAVLAELVDQVFTVERFQKLAKTARLRLSPWNNINSAHKDGTSGWMEHAPFDAIIITAATPCIPDILFEQVKPGGKIVAPVGPLSETQYLCCFEQKNEGRWLQKQFESVVFVPLLPGKQID